MLIPAAYKNRCVYHFTHIDNLPRLLEVGFLCNNHPDFPSGSCRSVAEPSIQKRRARTRVTRGPGGTVHDYVPLYFGSLSPMLLSVLNKKNVDQMDILYFEFPISLLCRDDVVFTDASANTDDPPNFFSDPAELRRLNWAEIDSLKWSSSDDERRHQRMAEVLVHGQLPLADATRVAVWNRATKEQVEKIVNKAGSHFPTIGYELPDRRHFFTKFFSKTEKNHSLVMGPREIMGRYRDACEQVAKKNGAQADAPFETTKELLEALRENFDCLPQTSELIGLKSENVVHRRTVDVHTLEVVENLKGLREFKALPPKYRDHVELAAYLHDIGKGPKARWAKTGGVQKTDPDHPVLAMPMMVEILTEKVKTVKEEDAAVILKLVCYHDLVGEVLGKGRDEQQIIDVARNKLELDMLFALGKADSTALVDEWWNAKKAAALYKRCNAAIKGRDSVKTRR